jgi:hypothetical protein
MEVTIPEAARLLRLSEYTIRRRLRTGELKGNQVPTAGGFTWLVEVIEDSPTSDPNRTDALIARLEAQIAAQALELEAKNQQIAELHVLLQQAQAALPAPRKGRPWWKRWRRD